MTFWTENPRSKRSFRTSHHYLIYDSLITFVNSKKDRY